MSVKMNEAQPVMGRFGDEKPGLRIALSPRRIACA